MVLLILLTLIVPSIGYSQIVTASFDRTTLSINPVAATSRNFSQMAFFTTFRTTNSESSQAAGSALKVKEEIKINKLGLYFTGHGRFAPELYLSRDAGGKTFSDADGNQTVDSTLINNFINLGLKMTRNLAIGFKFYAPSIEFDEKVRITYPGGTFLNVDAKVKSSTRGMGVGANYYLSNAVLIGGYYTKIQNKDDVTGSINDNGTTFDLSRNETQELSQYGIGLSYLKGGIGRGMRAELAYSKMEQPKDLNQEAGEEILFALDYSGPSFTFGGNIKYRKNAYYDHVEFMDYVIGDQIFNEDFTPSYGGFFSLSLKNGHTIGLSGILYRTTGQRQYYGLEQDAEIKVVQVTLNYAYLF